MVQEMRVCMLCVEGAFNGVGFFINIDGVMGNVVVE